MRQIMPLLDIRGLGFMVVLLALIPAVMADEPTVALRSAQRIEAARRSMVQDRVKAVAELSQAVADLEARLRTSASDEPARFWLGQAYLTLRKPGLARQQFAEAARLAPRNASNALWLGRVLLDLGRHDDAVGALTRASKLQPGNAGILYWLGRARLAAVPAGSKPDDPVLGKAVETLAAAVRIDPTNGPAQRWLARAQRRAGKLSDTVAHLKRAAVLLPASWEVRHELGELHAARGWDTAAITQYMEALELHPSPASASVVYRALGISCIRAGHPAEGVRALVRSGLSAKADPVLLYWLGRAQLGLGDHRAAAGLLESYLERRPTDAAGMTLLARAHYRRRDFTAARRWLVAALARGETASRRYWLGRTCYWLGRHEDAARHLSSAIGKRPSHGDSHLWLARTRMAQGRIEAAADAAHASWARAGFRTGNTADARSLLLRLAKLATSSGRVDGRL